MKLRTSLLSALSLLLLSSAASADVKVRDHRKLAAKKVIVSSDVDTSRWTLLGERSSRRRHGDTIEVGAQDGKFDQLLLVVDGGEMNLKRMVVHFGNGETFSPKVKQLLKDRQHRIAIDLPGNDRIITKIDLRYRMAKGAKTHVRIFGGDTRAEQPTYTPPVFDTKGWETLGERTVDGKHDKDVLLVGKDDGRFARIAFVVYDSDLILDDITIKFSNGEKMSTTKRLVFAEGGRTGSIDLPGETRFIEHISFKYSNVAGGGKARIVAYGLPAKVETETKAKVKVRDHRKHR